MDMVGACRAFVSVSERGSFTLGAAAAHIPQPVASRRIAALEKHLGARLFDRSTRRATLTPFGRDMLPSARRLVQLAEAMEYDAERARLAPVRLAVPDICATRDLARLDVEARRRGLRLDFHPAPPERRTELLRSQQVRAAITGVPQDEGYWAVPLGLASAAEPRVRTVYVETLRAGRADAARRRIWIQPEDDVPHIRDRLMRVRDTAGLRAGQVAVATALTGAAAEVLGSADFLLCSRGQAAELGLHWRPTGEVSLARGYDVAAATADDAERLRAHLRDGIARCLGAPVGPEAAE
ncbi:LysR family transcriptional regulator [Marinitenerispora sediminis]|uniref:LysR family transcriptional regulator n=1 Tax=Marinitenerispora sediminis TaxID=1931232 RepID=A0A368T5W2_9ACTN|nr:LysR family transcriptional regulator [Marinitenerispora sediminis]RCV51721.1 LysR family transcriptional regulator [Marinitenerispora sediminis]RCV55104.1 LysR family transcriptional regulator [Marinitenerispora sediminis]RCV59081.1 LysR family transcriptional regulator [Marinitenerispora sediminis]